MEYLLLQGVKVFIKVLVRVLISEYCFVECETGIQMKKPRGMLPAYSRGSLIHVVGADFVSRMSYSANYYIWGFPALGVPFRHPKNTGYR